ncbi:MAG TPA: rod shape-determining protein MreC [Candidatus Limnocylindrales bacterium]|nr:rod shape-determining protein MreC [Candidatus Limnocylindrales bacterium]
MIDISSRHRPLALLAGVVLAQVLMIAIQVRRSEHGPREVSLVRYWAVELITPFERAGTWTFSKIGGVWSGYVGLRNARSENERLRSENEDLKMRNRELADRAAEAERLAALLDFRKAHPEASMVAGQVIGASGAMVAAQVIGASADPNSHTIFINRGDHDRIRRNMAVITPNGIVGKVVEVFPNACQILLISDKESGVGALFEDTRTHGIIKGAGDSDPRMDYVMNDEKVHVGETILTSGDDRIFPKGLPIGTVEDAKAGNPFQIIHVRPAARLDRLEDVLVLLTMQELNLKKGEEPAAAPAASPAGANSNLPAPATSAAQPPKPQL